MNSRADVIVAWLVTVPHWLVYVTVASAAAIENLIPPIPGDVIIVAGAVAAGAGDADPWLVFLFVWLGNLGSALLVYWLGRRYGAAFFARPVGRILLAPNQLDALGVAYRRYGFPIIFFSRFLPVFRPVVPVFAGVARLGFWRTAVPLMLASAFWYGLLVFLGTFAGENWHAVLEFTGRLSTWFWLAAAVLLSLVAWWWWKTRTLLDRSSRGDPRA